MGVHFCLDTLYIVTCDISKLDKSACNMKSVSAAFIPNQSIVNMSQMSKWQCHFSKKYL